MHLPFMQIANELIDITAPEVAVRLNWDEEKACVGLIKMFRGALGRCPDHEPPSANAIIKGPHAAKLLARMAGYSGDPEEFARACAEASHPAVELLDEGIRIRGLDRYDGAWAKNNPELWKAWKEAHPDFGRAPDKVRADFGPKPARNRTGTVTEPEQVRTGTGPEPDHQMHMQMHTQKESKAAAGPPRPVSEYQEPTTPVETWLARDFFAWAQSIRQESGNLGEAEPRGLGSWYSEALMALRGEVAELQEAFYRFGQDAYWEEQKPAFPFRGFMKQWRDYVPQREVEHAGA